MIVNKLMRNSKNLKIQDLALLFIGCDKTNIGDLSSAVFFIILFTLRESRGMRLERSEIPSTGISFVADGSR
jgi:hypothetical protein